MRIAIDAMGGDHAPKEVIKGSIQAVKDFDINIVLIGKESIIKEELQAYKFPVEKVHIKNADEIITNEDTPTKAIKNKKDSSLVVGLKMLKTGEADAFVSAGNTGALLTGALLLVGRIKGVDRPALTPILPTDNGCALLVDAGANTSCKPENFLQFGIMGSAYMKKVLGIDTPRVGLVNVGTEEGKGNDLTKTAYNLLKNAPINFLGNIEAREIPGGIADVIVCDGFVGNVMLKLMEGMGLTFYSNIKKIFTKNILTYFSALLVKSGLKEFKKKMDYTEYGGAPLLGIDGVVIKAHGSSNAKAFYSAIRQTKKFVETGVIDEIKQYICVTGEDNFDSNE
ncbi:MAG: phosphate acyltransferase [Petroclostridium sp.]|jgi:glycerol-3-phosphate acyltransferase PlsX|uniref:phosphate acyltransferase PlsX n=1 Tax=Petroclostridium xylanilyticum TaxID=1792311 RepID=UPI000B986131|nr:phosphate acyltransferase PlsX [Petroclostridium xylanilyticum]MBZ4646250.1 plsX [Clostridia bacterium]MDK2810090.1 phosphate acyltransferase [Petroclostridium sp.]